MTAILALLLLSTSTVRVEAYSYSAIVTWKQVVFLDDLENPLPFKIIKETVTSEKHRTQMTFKVEGIPTVVKFYAPKGTTQKDVVYARIWCNGKLVFNDTFNFEEE